MHRLSAITCVGVLAVNLAGCGSDSEAPSTSSSQVVTTQPVAKPFENPPLVAQTSTVQVSSASGLIQATNPNQRAKQVQTGRRDPFAALFSPVVAKAPTAPAPSPPPQKPAPPIVRAPQPPRTALPPVVAAPPPAEPVSPQPDLAQGIAVTGIVQIGGETQAIVLVPAEGTSRYVREGQMLSNGQVLVKRIEVNPGAEPLVILEQNGIEVAKAIGAEPASEQKDAPTATDSSSSSPTPTINRNAPPTIPSPPALNNGNTPTTTTPSPPPPPDNEDESNEDEGEDE